MNIKSKQVVILLVLVLVAGFMAIGFFSDSEEEALVKAIDSTLLHADQCRKEGKQSALDCDAVLAGIPRIAGQAEKKIKEFKGMKPRVIQLYGRMARLANSMEDYRMAVRAYEKLTYYEPQTASNYGLLATALVRAGQARAATQYARLAVQLQPNQWHAHRIHARVLEANNDLREALESYQNALDLAPNDEKDKLEEEIVRLEQKIVSTS